VRGPVLIACGLVAVLNGAAPTRAEPAQHTYTVAIGVTRYSPVDGVDLGGYKFPAREDRPVFVRVDDLSSTPTPFVACQDINQDGECGGTGEPRVAACGSAFLSSFNRAYPLSVLVAVTSAPLVPPDCQLALGTTGTITVSYR